MNSMARHIDDLKHFIVGSNMQIFPAQAASIGEILPAFPSVENIVLKKKKHSNAMHALEMFTNGFTRTPVTANGIAMHIANSRVAKFANVLCNRTK